MNKNFINMDSLSIPMKSTTVAIVIAIIVIIAAIAGVLIYYNMPKTSTKSSSVSSSTSIATSPSNTSVTNSSKQLRIVSLLPSTTQILIALGLGKYIIAMDYGSYQVLQAFNLTYAVPKNVTILPLSQIYPPNISGLLLLHPTVVVVQRVMYAPYIPKMQQAGLNVLVVNTDLAYSFSQLEEEIMKIAEYFNVTSNGEKLVNWMNQKIAEFSSTGNTTVAFIFYIRPNLDMGTVGGNIYLNQIIVSAGGLNVFSTLPAYPTVSPSQLLLANPQVIIAAEMGENYSYIMSQISKIPGIQNVTAYKEGRIYIIDPIITDITGGCPLSVYLIELFHYIIIGKTPHYITASWMEENLNVTLPVY